MKETIGFGIIGAGMISEVHAKAMSSLKNVRLVAVYDAYAPAARARGAQFGVKSYTNLNEFLADQEIDAVTIAIPSGAHHSAVLAAARAGKHILCEKPLEINLERIDEMIRVCDENKVLLSTVFQTRFNRPVQLVRAAMRAGRFGRMVLASGMQRWYREPKYYSSSDWRGTWAMDGGGALMNQAIHMVDLLLYINGAPEEVFAFSGTLTHSIEVEDNLCASIKYRNGSFGTIEVSNSCAPGFSRRIEFSGSMGSVAFEENRIVRWNFVNPIPEDEEIRKELFAPETAHAGTDPTNVASQGHAGQISDLADAILTGKELVLDGREGRRAVEFICGTYESARTGKPFFFKH